MRTALILATMLVGLGCVPPPPPPPPGGGTGGAGGGTGGAGGAPGPALTCDELGDAVVAVSTAAQTCASDGDCTFVAESCLQFNWMDKASPYLNLASAAKVESLNAQRHAAQCGNICVSGNNPYAYCAPSHVCRPREESAACRTMAAAVLAEIEANRCDGPEQCTDVRGNWNIGYVCGVSVKSASVPKLKKEFHQFALMGCGGEDPAPPCP